jgi:hypothetical protein
MSLMPSERAARTARPLRLSRCVHWLVRWATALALACAGVAQGAPLG